MEQFDRRRALGMMSGAAAACLLPGGSAIAATPSFVMWRDPGCGCCIAWAERVQAAFGKKLPVVNSPNMQAVKRAQGVPGNLHSCHTSLIHGYVIEGHVPPADIKRLIASRSRTIRGLAAPGMPAGAPGMDVGHNHRERYGVIAFTAAGRQSVFATHG